jgi:tetratricopeptide (TPR) repeat protein
MTHASSSNLQSAASFSSISNPVPIQGKTQIQVSFFAQNILQQPSFFFDPASVIQTGNINIHLLSIPTVEEIQAKHLAEQNAIREQQIVRQLQVIGPQQNILGLRDAFQRARNPQQTELLHNPFPTIEDTALSLLQTGKELLYVDGKYDNAIYAFRLAIRNNTLDPDFRASDETNALLHYHMGMSYQMLDKLTEANSAYNAALDFKNATAATRAMIYGALADLHLLKGEIELALFAYKNALECNSSVDDHNAYWSCQLSGIYLQQGQITDALITCQNGLQIMHASADICSQLLDLLNRLKQLRLSQSS